MHTNNEQLLLIQNNTLEKKIQDLYKRQRRSKPIYNAFYKRGHSRSNVLTWEKNDDGHAQ